VIVFLNGSFGVGKTSVARALKRYLGAAIYNPEITGGVIRSLPHWLGLTNQKSGDYQDMPLWRNGTVAGIRLVRSVRPVVIVPMAFSNRAHLDEIMGKVRSFDSDVQHFCLVAPFDVVETHLRQRGDAPKHLTWQLRRAKVCCEAHKSPEFAIRIESVDREPDEIAREIARVTRIGRSVLA
jgi:chloramphenicol 3-O-phosphotransferase